MTFKPEDIKVIAFDADDTLWVNETFFREAEEKIAELLSMYETKNKIDQELFRIEIDNLIHYGYGIKGFVLSMIELALKLSNYTISPQVIEKILNIGKDMLHKPIELLTGVAEILPYLSEKYVLIVATKGDLLDQERKLEKSGLLKYFHHVEVMSEKNEKGYQRILNHLDVKPASFLMIGNSLKSDILPLIKMGSHAIHVPFLTTWEHEKISVEEQRNIEYHTIQNLAELKKLALKVNFRIFIYFCKQIK